MASDARSVLARWLAPSRRIPEVRWRAPSRWRPRPTTLAVLVLGLATFGLGEAFVVLAGLGQSPWTVFAEGLANQLGWSLGAATFLVGCTVLLLWIPLRERPGPGTLLNILVISTTLDLAVATLPAPEGLAVRGIWLLVGIALVGVGSGLYLTCGAGPGPRDGWMTGIHLRTGWPVARVRFGIELVVLTTGWLIGGTVGVGTLAFAVLIGPSVGLGLRAIGVVGRGDAVAREEVAAPDDPVFPELEA